MTLWKPSRRQYLEWVLTGALLAAGLLCLVPIVSVLTGAFLPENGRWCAAIRAAYAHPDRLGVLVHSTFVVTAGTVLVALILGVPAGFLCFRTDLPFRRVWVAGALVAAFVPAYVTVTSWMAWFGMDPWLSSLPAAAWLGGVALAPVVLLVSGICFQTDARQDLEDAARLDGTTWQVFRHVAWPGSVRGVLVAALAAGVLALWDITITDILVVRTFAEEILTQFQLGCGPQQAAAIALPVLGLGLLLAGTGMSLLLRHRMAKTGNHRRAASPMALGKARGAWCGLLSILATVIFVLPFVYLVRTAGSPARILLAWRTAGPELVRTIILVPLAATLCLPVAAAVAWRLTRPDWVRWPVLAAVVVWLVTPSPLVGIGLAGWLNCPEVPVWLCDSYAGVLLAWVIRALPFCALFLAAAFRQLPQGLLDLAALQDSGWLFLFQWVVLPQARRMFVAAWLLATVLCIGEIGASFLVVPPGRTTLTIRFFTLIHYGVYPDAAGICLLLLLSALVPVLGLIRLAMPSMCRATPAGVAP